FYHDYIEGRGTVSSIIGGWKFEVVAMDGRRVDRVRVTRGHSAHSV
ncbi:MAG: hypothetical protein B7Z80_14310, partial [Rhodospirillales bacterium 20-64-7]